jgi:hypothetical protein
MQQSRHNNRQPGTILKALRDSPRRSVGDAPFNEVFHPVAERLLPHSDAVLRVGGASQGLDLMVSVARTHGLRIYSRLDEVPGCESMAEPR